MPQLPIGAAADTRPDGSDRTMRRDDVRFESGGAACAAWLYQPERAAPPVPCVILAHGFSGVRDQRLPAFAERFAQAGMAARRAPRAEVGHYPCGHVGAWFERTVTDQTEFLTRQLLVDHAADPRATH